MTHAQTLIAAVQSGDPAQVRAVLAHLEHLADKHAQTLPLADRGWARPSYVDDRLPGDLGLTALHVAAKAYGAFLDNPAQAAAFDAMVADLLAAGASPWAEIGARGVRTTPLGQPLMAAVPGRTVPQECGRRLPPSLVRWIAEHCDDRGTAVSNGVALHSTTVVKNAARVQAWRERRQGAVALAS